MLQLRVPLCGVRSEQSRRDVHQSPEDATGVWV